MKIRNILLVLTVMGTSVNALAMPVDYGKCELNQKVWVEIDPSKAIDDRTNFNITGVEFGEQGGSYGILERRRTLLRSAPSLLFKVEKYVNDTNRNVVLVPSQLTSEELDRLAEVASHSMFCKGLYSDTLNFLSESLKIRESNSSESEKLRKFDVLAEKYISKKGSEKGSDSKGDELSDRLIKRITVMNQRKSLQIAKLRAALLKQLDEQTKSVTR